MMLICAGFLNRTSGLDPSSALDMNRPTFVSTVRCQATEISCMNYSEYPVRSVPSRQILTSISTQSTEST